MSFNDKQRRALKAKLRWRHVKTRTSTSGTVAYVEGWHVIAEANRIFGYDCWDRATVMPQCVWSETQRGQTACFYSTRVCITVRAGGSVVTREGIGTGFGRSQSPETAHEIALKSAETDATKRALATFGNPFGLALYDKDQANVAKPRRPDLQDAPGRIPEQPASAKELTLVYRTRKIPFTTVEAFVASTMKAIPLLTTIDEVYAFWEANLDAFGEARRRSGGTDDGPVLAIVAALKARARTLGYQGTATPAARSDAEAGVESHSAGRTSSASADGAGLAFPKEQRLRDKGHLAFVASHPCLVCGRRPAQAHHLRFAQRRAMAMKVSDEFTVPLCAVHHDALHRTADEQAWWARHGVLDPLEKAARLWKQSRGHEGPGDAEPEKVDTAVGDVGPVSFEQAKRSSQAPQSS